jgi:hypothetical protein
MKRTVYILITGMLLLVACRQAGDQPAGSDGWLTGDVQQKFETIAAQLGGFGRIMWEIDYRYHELYFAGMEMNWGYAGHQLEELQETLEDGLERRPARAASAQQFLGSAIPGIKESIGAADKDMFEKRFNILMNTCNSCHALEDMPFLTVRLPVQRKTAIR